MTEAQFRRQLGKRIKQLRFKAKLTQEAVSGYGIDVKQYQRIERGQVNPRAFTIIKLCEAFQCTPNKILSA